MIYFLGGTGQQDRSRREQEDGTFTKPLPSMRSTKFIRIDIIKTSYDLLPVQRGYSVLRN